MRKLATVETIADIAPIDGADNIETAFVRGWTVVVGKGQFKKGDLCIFYEIDTFLPEKIEAYAFLTARGRKMFNDEAGHVLKTARIRGQYSQGLILPIDTFKLTAEPGSDVSEQVGVTKYEPPIPATLTGEIAGAFPTKFASKTDAIRIQNLGTWWNTVDVNDWIGTEKIDGTSVTYINDNGTLRVCGRNWEYKPNDNTYWKMAEKYDILNKLENGEVVQGEIFGEGIQNNSLKMVGHHLRIFNMYSDRQIVPRKNWPEGIKTLAAGEYPYQLASTVEEAIEQANGVKSLTTPNILAEGIVWTHKDGESFSELENRNCFKVISNKWLLKQK